VNGRRLAALLLILLLVVSVVWWAGCLPPRPRQVFAQPSGYVWSVNPSATAPIQGRRYPLDSLARGRRGHPGLPILHLDSFADSAKVHRDLRPYLALGRSATQPVDVVIGLRDHLRVPRLPLHLVRISLDSAAVDSGKKQIDQIWTRFLQRRLADYGPQENGLRRAGATIRRELILTQAVIATIPRGRLAEIVRQPNVTSVVPARIRSTPPDVPEATCSKIQWIDGQVGLDSYRSAGLVEGRIRLLDTGVNDVHDYFLGVARTDPPSGAGPALILHNCVDDPNCGQAGSEDIESPVHGTPAAAILVAGTSIPLESRGITRARLHACRIWLRLSGVDYVDVDAYESALQGVFAPPPAVAAIQVSEPRLPDDVLADVANGAYEAGIAVLAAIGNNRAWNPLESATGARSPGSAEGVLGIGCRKCSDDSTPPSQSSGGVTDRDKPDVQFYSGTNSPGNGQDRIMLSGTSGATPYGAAAVLAMRGLLEAIAGIVDPGQVYAAIIACAEATRSDGGRFPSVNGAGLVSLPTDGMVWFSSADLDNGGEQTISIPVDASTRRIRVGLWWEDPGPLHVTSTLLIQRHRDFDLELLDPNGDVMASSSGEAGTFERVGLEFSATNTPTPGDWGVHIRARNVGLSPATVYWAASTSP
jgi:hypothetical protein